MAIQIIGIGIDIVDVSRFDKLKLSNKNKFLNRFFTKRELKYCFSKNNIAEHLATKFAGKEAVSKALSSTLRTDINFKEIEIINELSGAPKVHLQSDMTNKYQVLISLSNESDTAVGVAIVLGIT